MSVNTPNATPSHPLYNFFNPRRRRVISDTTGPSLTRQEFKDDCDINRIMAQFQRTGALAHFSKYAPMYGEFTACDYQEAQNLLKRARDMFDALPSTIRKEVATPEGFLDFVQNPANADKMAELGLTRRSVSAPGAAAPSGEPIASGGNPSDAKAKG